MHLPGAAVMTIGWVLFKLIGGVFVARYLSRATLLYGSIGAIVVLLLLLRFASSLFVYGAELSAIVAERRLDPPG